MKQFKSITSVVLALLVLLSTLSVTIEKHFCGDYLVDVSYFGNLQGCADEADAKDCDTKETIAKKGCCKDEVQHIKGQDKLSKTSKEKLNFEKQQFLVAFVVVYNNLFSETSSEEKPFLNHPPPDIFKDYQALHQVYII